MVLVNNGCNLRMSGSGVVGLGKVVRPKLPIAIKCHADPLHSYRLFKLMVFVHIG